MKRRSGPLPDDDPFVRTFARAVIGQLARDPRPLKLPAWRRCAISQLRDGRIVMSVGAKCNIVDPAQLKRELSPENFKVVSAMLEELRLQAYVSGFAMPLAKQALATEAKRAAPRQAAAEAAKSRAHRLREEFGKLQAKRPSLTKTAGAALLSSKGDGGRHAIRKALGRTPKK